MGLIRGGAMLNIATGLREHCRAAPNATAVVDGDRTLTYGQLDDRATRLGNAFLEQGLTFGDRVAVLLGNRLEYPEVAAGLGKVGLPFIPLNPRLTAREVESILDRAQPSGIVVDGALRQRLGRFAEQVPRGRLLGISDDPSEGDYESALDAASPEDQHLVFDEEHPFAIPFTSGTTGLPKGALLSHRSRALAFHPTAMEWGLGVGRRTIAVAPMYHGAGFLFAYAAVATGGTVSMLRAWDAAAFLNQIASFRPHSVFLVPAHVQQLRALPAEAYDLDLTSIEVVYTNAAPMPQAGKEWILERFPGVALHEVYGSTEGGIVANLRPPDARRKQRCVGPPWSFNEVKLLDGTGEEVPQGTPGVLYNRSPFLFSGYLDDPAATDEATTEDGFVTAGDVAVTDDEGFLYIIDRVKDMILTGGVNVYPREIEEVLHRHPAVADVAVIGVPDERWGEAVTAIVVPAREKLDVESLVSYCREHLAGYKVPKRFHPRDELPRNAAGKVLKRELREAFPT